MPNEIKDYRSYDHDNLDPGHMLKVEHTVHNKEHIDLSDLIAKSIDEVKDLRESNIAIEQAAYEKVREIVKEWEKNAAVTGRFDRAIEYLKVPQVKHTSNKLTKGKSEYDYNEISNRVYKMSYRIYERSNWRTKDKKYNVTWYIFTNSPRSNYNVKVAGQEKTYKNKEEAEKYIQGRIKAYSHLFTEISPTIPKEYEQPFKVYGHLLPGYTTEETQKAQEIEKLKAAEKSSIRKQLNPLKEQEKSTLPKQIKTRPEAEL